MTSLPHRAVVPHGSTRPAFDDAIPATGDASLSRGLFVAQQHLLSLRRDGILGVSPPPSVSAQLWQLEHLRLLLCDLNNLVGRLAGHCTATSCPVMGTADLQYLCASHATPRECTAMDYSIHTLDGASALISSSRTFPSRVSVGDAAATSFPSLVRRLYRVLSHAWHHHASIFADFEGSTLCAARITAVAIKYGLLTPEQLLIAPAALARGREDPG